MARAAQGCSCPCRGQEWLWVHRQCGEGWGCSQMPPSSELAYIPRAWGAARAWWRQLTVPSQDSVSLSVLSSASSPLPPNPLWQQGIPPALWLLSPRAFTCFSGGCGLGLMPLHPRTPHKPPRSILLCGHTSSRCVLREVAALPVWQRVSMATALSFPQRSAASLPPERLVGVRRRADGERARWVPSHGLARAKAARCVQVEPSPRSILGTAAGSGTSSAPCARRHVPPREHPWGSSVIRDHGGIRK